MEVISSAFKTGEAIPKKYTCDDMDISPPLTFKDIPKGTISLALIADDPDAPGGIWVHWLVWNIDPSVNEISQGEEVRGIKGRNDFGRLTYGGPCPPRGTHRYYFKLYALDKQLDLKKGSTKKDLVKAMEGHIIEKAQLMGIYTR